MKAERKALIFLIATVVLFALIFAASLLFPSNHWTAAIILLIPVWIIINARR